MNINFLSDELDTIKNTLIEAEDILYQDMEMEATRRNIRMRIGSLETLLNMIKYEKKELEKEIIKNEK